MLDTRTPPPHSAVTSWAASLDRYAPYVLSILRIMAALLFMEHGLSKFFGFPWRWPGQCCSIWNGLRR